MGQEMGRETSKETSKETQRNPVIAAFVLGLLLCIGLATVGYLLGNSLIRFKSFERVVAVKGLSEREVQADTAIWPIKFIVAENELDTLYTNLETRTTLVAMFLEKSGFASEEISVSAPSIQDKQAQGYGDSSRIPFRYSATQILTVYTPKVEQVIQARKQLVELVKSGVVIIGDDYQARTEFIYNGLNDLKPAMVEEATRNAREVAQKFAQDSGSRLGQIKTARQGQFSIRDRDSNTPQIKRVRVVSTIEYYLSD